MSQKLDQELEKALSALESERNDALSNLDNQVRPLCTCCLDALLQGSLAARSGSVRGASAVADCNVFGAQVEKLSAEILARVLPEGIKI